jgi:hypothetical protein
MIPPLRPRQAFGLEFGSAYFHVTGLDHQSVASSQGPLVLAS